MTADPERPDDALDHFPVSFCTTFPQPLTAQTANAQTAFTNVTGRSTGTHTYRAELHNAVGTTSTQSITVSMAK